MNKVSTGVLTGSLKPKYRRITVTTGEGYVPTNGLDIFLDFNTFVRSMSSYKKLLNAMPFQDHMDTDMLASIITTFKHWKDYTRKWENVRIFGFVNDFEMAMVAEQKAMRSYLGPYINKFSNERFKQLVYYWNEAWKTASIIMNYVPGMYLIKTKRFDSYVIPEVIDDYKNNKRDRIIVSGNPLMTSYQFSERTMVLYSRFTREGMTQLSDPIAIAQSITKIDEDIMREFVQNKVCFNLLNAIVGDYERGIIGLPQTSITTTAYNLLKRIERHEIPENPKSVESILPAIDKKYHDYIKQAYPLIDVELHAQLVPQSMIEAVKTQMVDKYDIDGLNSITVEGINLLELL